MSVQMRGVQEKHFFSKLRYIGPEKYWYHPSPHTHISARPEQVTTNCKPQSQKKLKPNQQEPKKI